ncbi:MAG: sulfide/dihydroorotate dehydrogenase-like FAD/NAD-binding protein [Phycisphaerales bacterium]|nr:sulfide/dihydroorotate dehydrogenase-like FAD/NAD-binding protein [Phycisphaerales bacterium]MCB9862240.1 sulfide/dihydroorotate dehydrogenase-like FAD/NAD-binding protein [Phycisphaerales bacterium]
MFRILDARRLASDVKWFRIKAPLAARNRQPGQFVILRLEEGGERIPLTMAAADRESGTIELIVKAIGATTKHLCELEAGDDIADIMGPLGKPTEIHACEHAVLVGGGVGTAVIYPLAPALREAGCFVTAITGGRTHDLVVLEAELRSVCDDVCVTTDDGSYGFKGNVADRLEELLSNATKPVGVVYAAGPVPMMRAVCDRTRPHKIRTIVSLNPIMVDGTGMCGGCRITVGGQQVFACVDGPEFDGHEVDFDELADRLTAYRTQERTALERFEREHGHACASTRLTTA